MGRRSAARYIKTSFFILSSNKRHTRCTTSRGHTTRIQFLSMLFYTRVGAILLFSIVSSATAGDNTNITSPAPPPVELPPYERTPQFSDTTAAIVGGSIMGLMLMMGICLFAYLTIKIRPNKNDSDNDEEIAQPEISGNAAL